MNTSITTPLYTQETSQVLSLFDTDERGLNTAERKQRSLHSGRNALPVPPSPSLFFVFIRQFTSPLILLLLCASVLLGVISGPSDSIVIGIVLLCNAIIGTIQEGKAQKALASLSKLTTDYASILIDGVETKIPTDQIVPGDVFTVREGDRIPADGRIISASQLRINESMLTGESLSTHKQSTVIKSLHLPIGDQRNLVFKGTVVSAGTGVVVVTAIGVDTEIGKIGVAVQDTTEHLPLTKHIETLSKQILIVVSILSVVFLIIGFLRGVQFPVLLATIISLCVSVIPEGLPIIVTTVLALGVYRMSKRNAVVKRLQAVEALGHADIIALDKTGTITKNELCVTSLWSNDSVYTLDPTGFDPTGNVYKDGHLIEKTPPNLAQVVAIIPSVLTAHVVYDSETDTWNCFGDPTEGAIRVVSDKLRSFIKKIPTVEVIESNAFDYKKLYSSHLLKIDSKQYACFIGAPEAVLSVCDQEPKGSSEQIQAFSTKGLRVVALALYETNAKTLPKKPVNLPCSQVNLFGIEDTLVPNVSSAIQSAKLAGIKVVMITGDHKETAIHIARVAGIYHPQDDVLTGTDLEELQEHTLRERLKVTTVFARVNPEQKLKIINLYQSMGKTVAMTGDGVNDASSLVSADLGIAMGKRGTDVAKEASDIVLLDDNFNSITSAIEEGRNIYATLKRVIAYLFSTGSGEVCTLAGALLLGLPLPLLPTQLIWLNFVTDGFLDIALSFEPTKRTSKHRS